MPCRNYFSRMNRSGLSSPIYRNLSSVRLPGLTASPDFLRRLSDFAKAISRLCDVCRTISSLLPGDSASGTPGQRLCRSSISSRLPTVLLSSLTRRLLRQVRRVSRRQGLMPLFRPDRRRALCSMVYAMIRNGVSLARENVSSRYFRIRVTLPRLALPECIRSSIISPGCISCL